MAHQTLNAASYVPGGASSSHSFNLTLSAGVNRKLIVVIASEGSQTVSTLTFDGTSIIGNLVVSKSHTTATTLTNRLYYYDIPDGKGTGSYAVAFTLSGASVNFTGYAWHTENSVTGAPEASTSAESSDASTTPLLVTSSLTVTDQALVFAAFSNSSGTPTWDSYVGVTERTESNEGNFTSACADGLQSGAGSKTVSGNNNVGSVGYHKIMVAASVAYSAPVGPTINTQPSAVTTVLAGPVSNNPATFTTAATTSGGSLTYDWELETSVGGGVYANLADGNGATWTGQTSASCSATITATTLSGRRVRCNVTDDNGTTTTDAVALTIYAGTTIAQPAATDGSGNSDMVLTSDVVDSADGQLKLITTTKGSTVIRTTARKTA